jgi:hypothetical protein
MLEAAHPTFGTVRRLAGALLCTHSCNCDGCLLFIRREAKATGETCTVRVHWQIKNIFDGVTCFRILREARARMKDPSSYDPAREAANTVALLADTAARHMRTEAAREGA